MVFGEAMADLKIVGETIDQRFESANLVQRFSSQKDGGAEREVERLQGLRLQDLAPEVGVDGHGFPLHGGGGGIAQAIKTMRQGNPFFAQWRHHVHQKIGGHAHVGVTDKDEIIYGGFFQLCQGGDFGVGAERFATDEQLRVRLRMAFEQFFDDFASGIGGVGHAEEELHRTGVLLIQPGFQ